MSTVKERAHKFCLLRQVREVDYHSISQIERRDLIEQFHKRLIELPKTINPRGKRAVAIVDVYIMLGEIEDEL